MRCSWPLWAALVACSGPEPTTPAVDPPTDPPPTTTPADGLVRLDPVDQAWRVSMAVRGHPPTVAELEQVAADPEALPALLDTWLHDPAFAATIRDMWAEILLLRNDTFNQLPALGELEGFVLDDLYQGTVEEPLALVEHIVVNDRPFTEIVTADYMLTGEITARMYGVDYDFVQGGWQVSQWPDARPRAGLLSSAQVWRRWESDGSNFNRGRANMVAERLLCDGFDMRDILVEGGIDIADEEAVAEAVVTNPSCVSCHQGLDPLAGYFWGYKKLVHRNYVADSITNGCAFNWENGNEPEFGTSYLPEDYCYPLVQYTPADEDDWHDWGLRPPGYYGVEARDLSEVGELIADDPRFHQCMARRFFGYLSETDAHDVPFELTVELTDTFVQSDFDARALVRAAVLHPQFAAVAAEDGAEHPIAGLKVVRPEQYARTVEHLTGYRWWSMADRPDCDAPGDPDVQRFGTQCWGDVDLSVSDVKGFRAMAGGVDGKVIVHPTHAVTPTKLLVTAQIAEDAAGYVVDEDLALAPADRRLLGLVEPDTTDEVVVTEQIEVLYATVLGQLDPDPADVQSTLGLWRLGLQSRGTPADGWRLVLAAMLQDPELLFW